MKNIELHNVIFDNSKLVNIRWEGVMFARTFFNRAELHNINFYEAALDATTLFWDSILSNVSFQRSHMDNNPPAFDGATFDNVDFTGTSLEGYDIAEITKDRREDL